MEAQVSPRYEGGLILCIARFRRSAREWTAK